MEIRKNYHQQLDEIQHDIVRLAAYVTEAIPRGTDALLTMDLASAQALIDDDDIIDSLAIDIEERCYKVLALQNPMASDMRAIVTAIRLTAEIERSGDLMVNTCKAARRMYPIELPPIIRGFIQAMSEDATKLFRVCIDAYAEADAGLAAALDDMDDRLDQLHHDYIQAVLSDSMDLEIQPRVQLALVGRYYERIGDHAVNIAERVRYMVDGWLPEHAGAARHAARQRASEAVDEDALAAPGDS
jgi:phosphate transport system protein